MLHPKVNANVPQNAVCMGILAKYSNQFMIIDRCAAFVFEQHECFEFVSQINSLSILETLDCESAARASFEKLHQRDARLITLSRKPFEFDNIRTVSVRDICGCDNG